MSPAADGGGCSEIRKLLTPAGPHHEVDCGVPQPDNLRMLDELRARFDDYCDYARTAKRHSPASIRWYREALKNYVRFVREALSRPAAEFRRHALDVEGWARWNARRGLRPITVNSLWRALRGFFADCEKRDGAESPFHGLPAPKAGVSIPKARTPEECQRVLIAAENYPWHGGFARALAVATISVMLYAGLRRGEVCRLLRADVQLDTGTIRVVRGKGAYEGKDRTAYIPPELDLILREYLRWRQRHRVVAPEFFVTAATRRALQPMSLVRIVRAVGEAAGVAGLSCHVLRHSFVTQVLRAGVPLHIARELAGHADIETTLGYLRVFDEDRAAEVKKVSFRAGRRWR